MEAFTAEERAALAPYFTNLDGPVFALVNLPEVVKGALFARYSRSAKSLRRLFLDEFLETGRDAPRGPRASRAVGPRAPSTCTRGCSASTATTRSPSSGGVHLACEGASNLLTKVLEWGRLMAYLEQSTRYVPYTDRPGGAGSTTSRLSSQGTRSRDALRRDPGPRLRDLRPLDRAAARSTGGAASPDAGRVATRSAA